jgi:hypothetical protein
MSAQPIDARTQARLIAYYQRLSVGPQSIAKHHFVLLVFSFVIFLYLLLCPFFFHISFEFFILSEYFVFDLLVYFVYLVFIFVFISL